MNRKIVFNFHLELDTLQFALFSVGLTLLGIAVFAGWYIAENTVFCYGGRGCNLPPETVQRVMLANGLAIIAGPCFGLALSTIVLAVAIDRDHPLPRVGVLSIFGAVFILAITTATFIAPPPFGGQCNQIGPISYCYSFSYLALGVSSIIAAVTGLAAGVLEHTRHFSRLLAMGLTFEVFAGALYFAVSPSTFGWVALPILELSVAGIILAKLGKEEIQGPRVETTIGSHVIC